MPRHGSWPSVPWVLGGDQCPRCPGEPYIRFWSYWGGGLTSPASFLNDSVLSSLLGCPCLLSFTQEVQVTAEVSSFLRYGTWWLSEDCHAHCAAGSQHRSVPKW